MSIFGNALMYRFVIEGHMAEWLFQLKVYTSLNIVYINNINKIKYESVNKNLNRIAFINVHTIFAYIFIHARLIIWNRI